LGIAGRPPLDRDFQRQKGPETLSMPANHGLRSDDREGVQNLRAQPLQRYKDKPIPSCQPRSPSRRPTQHVDLVAQDQELSFKASPRLEANGDPVQ
jgi:hypothetical protein